MPDQGAANRQSSRIREASEASSAHISIRAGLFCLPRPAQYPLDRPEPSARRWVASRLKSRRVPYLEDMVSTEPMRFLCLLLVFVAAACARRTSPARRVTTLRLPVLFGALFAACYHPLPDVERTAACSAGQEVEVDNARRDPVEVYAYVKRSKQWLGSVRSQSRERLVVPPSTGSIWAEQNGRRIDDHVRAAPDVRFTLVCADRNP